MSSETSTNSESKIQTQHYGESNAANSSNEPGQTTVLMFGGFYNQSPEELVHRRCQSLLQFQQQLEYLEANYQLVGLSTESRDFSSNKPKMTLAFDGGLYGFYKHIAPLLNKGKIPHVICLPAGLVGKQKPIWNVEIELLLLNHPNSELTVPMRHKTKCFAIGSKAQRKRTAKWLGDHVGECDQEERSKILNSIRKSIPMVEYHRILQRHRDLQVATFKQVTGHDQPWVEYAAQGMNHIPLTVLETAEVLCEEMVESKRVLEGILGRRIHSFQWPPNAVQTGSVRLFQRALVEAEYQQVLSDEECTDAATECSGFPIIRAPKSAVDLRERLNNSAPVTQSENGKRFKSLALLGSLRRGRNRFKSWLMGTTSGRQVST